MDARKASVSIGLLAAALAFAAGTGRLFDNSFLTHLTTGRLILDDGFPYHDPYTFTSAGESWFPQSWLASVLYGAVDELGGGRGLRLHFAVTTGALGALGWLLTRPAGTLPRRLLALAPFLAVGVLGWSHRPYLLAYACLAGLLLVADGRLDRRWLVPIGWVWLNVHGSWPLGLAAAGALWFGRRLDGEDTTTERRALGWFSLGLVAGCLNPYGPRLLAFPVVAVRNREVFAEIKEWKPPTFDSPGQLAFLGAIALAVVALRLRPSWRILVPVLSFTIAALLSMRNLQVAAFVFVPVTAAGLAGGRRELPPLLLRAAPVLAAAVVVVGAVVATRPPAFDEDLYPVAATVWLADHDLTPVDARVVAPDFVGNWFSATLGRDARVFIDDRFELASAELVDDYLVLLHGEPGWEEALAAYDPDAVVWPDERPLASLLEESECWEITHRDDDWVVAVPSCG